MYHISIISSSIRTGRKSHRVALYFEKYLKENNLATSEILDLKSYNFPVFEERLKFQEEPLLQTLEFAKKIKLSDGVIIVTPEYNGSFPASLKNVIDLLYEEWYHKPIGISTVSAGAFGGSQVLISLQFVLWKMMALTVPVTFSVSKIGDSFDELGKAQNKTESDKLAAVFTAELLRCIKRGS
jgi:NAD(P)H-dependent FMN reductase